MASFTLRINETPHTVDVDSDMPLLWVLRDIVGLTGTKFGCGRGLCGCCTVHINGEASRSCSTPVSYADGKSVTTIEGLALHPDLPVLKAWIAEDVPQCGYCIPGQIMQAASLIRQPHLSEQEITDTMSTMLCRCGTYPRVKRAIRHAVKEGGAR